MLRLMALLVVTLAAPMQLSAQDIEIRYDKFTDSTKVIAQGTDIGEDDEFTEALFKAIEVMKDDDADFAESPIAIRVTFDCAGEGYCRADHVMMTFAAHNGGIYRAGAKGTKPDSYDLIFLVDDSLRIRHTAEPLPIVSNGVVFVNMPFDDLERLAGAQRVDYKIGDVEASVTTEQLAVWKELVSRVRRRGEEQQRGS